MIPAKKSIFKIALITGLLIAVTGCKKEVTLPDTSLRTLYGTWEWKESYCGWSGKSTPASTGHSSTVQFKKNGVCIWKQDGKDRDKMKYTVSEGTSMLSKEKTYFLEFEDKSLFKKEKYWIKQNISFSGNDTLYLIDEADDGCGSTYVRKK